MKPRTPIRPLIIREKSYTLHLVTIAAQAKKIIEG